MPSEIRQRFSKEWEGMAEVVDLVEEVEKEEREDMEREENLTREPNADEESEEEDEEEPEKPNYEELQAHLKTMNEDDKEKFRNFETFRNLANRLPPDYKMDDLYKAMKELKEEETEESESASVLEEMRWVAREHPD